MPRSIMLSQRVKGKRPQARPFMDWSATLKQALTFAMLPDSGEWLEGIGADDWRDRISGLTDMQVMIFKETRAGTE